MPAASTNALAPALLRLRPADPIGAAWLVGPYRALTCAHCVRGLEIVEADWPLLPGLPKCLAHVMERDEQADVAVLALNAAPPEAAPAPWHTGAVDAHPFSAFGFPAGHPHGVWAAGQLAKPNAAGWVQFAGTTPTGKRVEPGFSGGPVWDDAMGAVVGMVVASDVDPLTQVAFMIPLGRLVAYLDVVPGPSNRPAINPFHAGGATPPEKFVGRATTLTLARQRLNGRSPQSLSIVGDRRIGKSSLLHYIHTRPAELWPTQTPIVVYLDLQRAYCHTRAGWMKAFRREFIAQTQATRETASVSKTDAVYTLWNERDDGDLTALAFALDDLHTRGVRLILALDEVEELTKRRAEFDDLLEELRGAGQAGKIAILTASARPLADLCQTGGLTSPFYNIFVQETLGLLTPAEGHALVRAGLPAVTAAQLNAIEHLAGQSPHPFYTALAARRLWESDANWQTAALADCLPHWQHLWAHLSSQEQTLIRALGLSKSVASNTLMHTLRTRGLLHPMVDKPFSAAFAQWIINS